MARPGQAAGAVPDGRSAVRDKKGAGRSEMNTKVPTRRMSPAERRKETTTIQLSA